MYLGEEPAGWLSQCGKEPSLPVYELVVDSLQFWGWMSREVGGGLHLKRESN